MSKIQFKRGLQANVQAAPTSPGEPLFATDTKKLYIGTSETEKVCVNDDLPNSGVTAGRYPVVTVDSKGIVTKGEKLAYQDIPNILHSQVNGLGTSATCDVGGSAGNVVALDNNGKVPSWALPAIAMTDVFVVATETAMLALTAQAGDVAVRTDLSKSFILKTSNASVKANWQELLTPTDSVSSVNGRTGAVTVTKADVGLGNVTNEAKATMFESPNFTGVPTATVAHISDPVGRLATVSTVNEGIDTAVSRVVAKAYITMAQVEAKGYTTMSSVAAKGYITMAQVEAKEYATTSYVTSQGYLKPSDVIDGGTF